MAYLGNTGFPASSSQGGVSFGGLWQSQSVVSYGQFVPMNQYNALGAMNPQMLVQMFSQLLQVFSSLQSGWASTLGASAYGAAGGSVAGAYGAGAQPPVVPFPCECSPQVQAPAYQPAPAPAPAYTAPAPAPAPAPAVDAYAAVEVKKEEPAREPAKINLAVAINIQEQRQEEVQVFSGGGGDGGDGGGDGGDPIILDLNGDNQLDVTGADGSKINFNLFGNGTDVKTEWLKKGTQDGLLVSDFNGDGKIDSGRELMRTTGVNGEQGMYSGGWDKLSKLFDKDQDGKVAGDELANLQVWVDANGDGVSDEGELRTLAEAGVTQIDVPTEGVRSTFTVNGKQQLAEDYIFDLEQ